MTGDGGAGGLVMKRALAAAAAAIVSREPALPGAARPRTRAFLTDTADDGA